jgi:outer membrane lipoprotein-sorting protein
MISGSSARLRRLLAALLLAGAALNATAAGDWGLEQLMQALGQVKTAKAKFVERKYLAMLDTPLELSGTLVYSAPGRLEIYTLRPKPESLVLEQDRLVMENPARNQRRTLDLQEYPVVWAFVESFRSTLAGDLPTLHRFYRTRLEGNEAQWRLTLKPIEPKMQTVVSEIRIEGSRNRIRTIEINETVGNRSVMTMTEDAP